MNKRARIIITGRVQGAAYRDNVERIAYELHITGTVCNLEDRTVEIVCEGNPKILSEFLRRINIRRWPIIVEKIKATYEKPTGEFRDFYIIRGNVGTRDILDRLDLGLGYMSELNAKQDRTIHAIETVGSSVKTMDGHVRRMDNHITRMDGSIKRMDGHVRRMDGSIKRMDGHVRRMDGSIKRMDGHIKKMDSNMGTRFDRLDKKYDRFGKTLSGAARDIHAIRKAASPSSRSSRARRKSPVKSSA